MTPAVTTGLVGRWQLNDGDLTAADSGGGDPGTLSSTGTQWIPNALGGYGSLAFNGSGRVDLGNPTDLNFTGAITVSASIQVQTIATNGINDIVAHGYTESPDAEVFLRIYKGSYEFGTWNGTSGHNAAYTVPAADVGTGAWVQLTGVFDPATMDWLLYRDGTLVASDHDTAGGAMLVGADWGIGGDPGDATRSFTGAISDVRIYDQALSQTQVTDLAGARDGLATVSASPLVVPGQAVTLTATTYDPYGLVTAVSFYRDAQVGRPALSRPLRTSSWPTPPFLPPAGRRPTAATSCRAVTPISPWPRLTASCSRFPWA